MYTRFMAKEVILAFRVSEEEARAIQDLARAEERTVSHITRRLVMEGLNQHGQISAN